MILMSACQLGSMNVCEGLDNTRSLKKIIFKADVALLDGSYERSASDYLLVYKIKKRGQQHHNRVSRIERFFKDSETLFSSDSRSLI